MWILVLDFVRKNAASIAIVVVVISVLGIAYSKGASSQKKRILELELAIESKVAIYKTCKAELGESISNEQHLRDAIERMSAEFQEIINEKDKAAENIRLEHDRILHERMRNWSMALGELRRENANLRQRMTDMTTCEACDAAMREISR